jgi:hypothetical protein
VLSSGKEKTSIVNNPSFAISVLLLVVAGAPGTTTAPPRTTTYAIARASKQPYRCTYSSQSFMGTTSSFTADVLGDDFIWIGFFRTYYGPTLKAFAALDAGLRDVAKAWNQSTRNTLVVAAEYLEAVITR